MDCQEIIYSNDFADYIIDRTSVKGKMLLESAICSEDITEEYTLIHVPRDEDADEMRGFLNYQNLPRLFGLLDIDHLEDVGVLEVQRNPAFDLFGKNVILGVIDTGIDYKL